MRFLVTGATGFIGNHVVQSLLAGGHEVVACGRDPEKAELLDWSGKVQFEAFHIGEDAGELIARCGKPDALIHAAWSNLDNYRDPIHFEQVLQDHYRFISSMVRQGLGQCLVLGTCLEYGMQEGPLREEMPCRPLLAYPLAKHLLRQMLEGLQSCHDFTLQWARLFYTWGPGQRPGSLVGQLEHAISSGATDFPMSPGDQIRDYMPVETLAATLVAIAEHRSFDGIVNCCSGEGVAVRTFVETLISESGARIPVRTGAFGYAQHEPFAFWGDTGKLRNLLGETVP